MESPIISTGRKSLSQLVDAGRPASRVHVLDTDISAMNVDLDAELFEIDLDEKTKHQLVDEECAILRLVSHQQPRASHRPNHIIARLSAYTTICVILLVAWCTFSWYFVRACFWPLPTVGLGANDKIFNASIGFMALLVIFMLAAVTFATRLVLRRGRTAMIITVFAVALFATVTYLSMMFATIAHPYSNPCDLAVTAFITAHGGGNASAVLYATQPGSMFSTSAHLGAYLRTVDLTVNSADRISSLANLSLAQHITYPEDDAASYVNATALPFNSDEEGSVTGYVLEYGAAWPQFAIRNNATGEFVMRGAHIAPTSCHTVKVCAAAAAANNMTSLLSRVMFAQAQFSEPC